VSVLAFKTVSFRPVGSSCLSASSSQGFCTSGLAVLLLSISAGGEVVLDESVGSSGHLCSRNAVGSVGTITSNLGLSKRCNSAVNTGSSIGTVADGKFLTEGGDSAVSAWLAIGSVADRLLLTEGGDSAVSSWLTIGSIADGLLLNKSVGAIRLLASSRVSSVADREVVSLGKGVHTVSSRFLSSSARASWVLVSPS
jgi:hypothetical protein